LPALQSQQRFHHVFGRLLRALATAERPVVLLLDDLQWADPSTLDLLSFLLGDPELRGLLVVGAFRSGELKPGDAFAAALDEMRRAAARCTELGLGPMDDEAVTALLAETLRAPLEEVAKLAAPCRQRTGGNPFFLRRFLLKLREDGRIAWDASAGRFRVSPEAVHESASTENVAALLAESLGRLPESTREALLAAACLGRSFRLDALAGLLERPPEAIAGALAPAFGAGLLVALDNGWDHVAHGAGLDAGAAFVHDRVSEAARSLGADERRQVLHRRAAERLLSGTGEADLPDRVFEIVGHLRRCRPLLRSPAELLRLAELDLLAARRARGSGAWSAMLEAAEEGLTALGEDGWSRPDRLCRDLHLEAAEAAALCGRADDMDRWTEAVLQHSADAVEATPAIILRVATWTGANRAGEALRASLAHLRKLGLRFPEPPPSSPALLWSIARFRWEIGQLRPDAVGRLPPMTDARALAATRLLMHSAAAVLVACPQLAALTIPAMLRLALRHGNAPESAFAWIGAAMLLAGVLGAPAAAADWERVALELTSDPRNARMRARVEFAASYASRPQHLPAREIRPLMLESWKLGLQGGDFEFAAYSGSGFIHLGLCAGADLEELEARAGEIADHLHRHRQQLVGARFASYHRAVLKLRHPSEDPCRLDGPGGSEEELLADYARRSDAGAEVYFWLSRLQLCCVFGRWGDAVAAALRMDGLMEGIRSTYIEAPAAFWTALALHAGTGAGARAGADVAGPAARAERTVRRYAHRVHEDHAHRLEMLRAEKARAAGRTQVAADAYDAALRLAAAAGNPAEEALAAERAASLQREAARSWVADAYLRTARFAWIRWGAGAKVEALDAEFPGLAAGRDGPGSASRGTLSPDGSARSRYRSSVATAGRDRSDGSSAARGGPDLDVETILRASEALGSALVLEDLVRRLMDLAIENAGAQRSVLLLPGEAGFTLEGDVDAEWGTARVREGLPLSRAAQRVPASIVQFVARSGEALVLDDPAAAGDFAQDAYLRSHAPRSVLCAPLRHRGTLSGILYLENRLAPGTFTAQRLALLTTLSGSMSVALENARLYARISDLNRAYERFVPRRFLALLDRRSIVDVLLGDQVEREMTVMFSDIRGFTTLSEKMNPRDTFAFINEFLGRMEPVVARHDGVIDKYIGDAIMALFPTGPDSALRASIAMLRALRDWNEERGQQGRDPVRIGIGLNSGHLMLGTVGTDTRMDGTVVSDAVNLASRVEDLTKEFGVPLLLTESTVSGLLDTLGYGLRPVDEVRVRGKQTATLVYECFDADPEPVRERKKTTADEFRRVWTAWRGGRAAEAMAGFDALLAALPGDSVVLRLRERCKAEAVAAAALPEA
jgi:predicted ATPase/class 3 adenylate cyclase